MRALRLFALASALAAGPVRAQQSVVVVPHPLQAMPVADLTFGTVLAGVSRHVLASGAQAGVFEIQGLPVQCVRIEFALPPALVAVGGIIPLSFGPGDGFAGLSLGTHHGSAFDPHNPLTVYLGDSGLLFVRLGGTALPAVPQAHGEYHATISITVYDLGS